MDSSKETSELSSKSCKPCEGGMPPMSEEEISRPLKELDGWEYNDGKIRKEFTFKDHYETMTFVNAIAWISHREGHHPDLEVGYNRCAVKYATHAIGGLSENDFICAAKIDLL